MSYESVSWRTENENKKVSVLFSHIYLGNLPYVRQYLAQFKKIKPHEDINESVKGSFDYTPLHYAVLWNKLEIVKELVKMGSNPKIRILPEVYPAAIETETGESEKGIEPIYLAENFGKIRIAKILRPYTNDYDRLQEFFKIGKFIANYKNGKTFFEYEEHRRVFPEKVRILLMIGKRLQQKQSQLPVELWNEILSFWRIHDLIYRLICI